jgi:hypothetical protein
MNATEITPIEPGNRIQLPASWVAAVGINGLVTLEWKDDGILVRPCTRLTWDDISATKLQIGSAPHDENPGDVEVTGDDFLF